MSEQTTFLVLGGTGQTGRHFVAQALREGHRVRALARTPEKLAARSPDLQAVQGSITEDLDLDGLVRGVDAVVCMLGDVQAQRTRTVNAEFVQRLVPAMRRQSVTRLLYQAGALSRPPGGRLSPALWAIRQTVARGYDGQHRDNEAVMRYLVQSAPDLQWVVHRAGIGSDGPSKGVLQRSGSRVSVGTFVDCATYSHRLLTDASAIRTCDLSAYR